MPKTALVVGSGGRECSILRKLAQSKRIGRLLAAPGNGDDLAENIPIRATEIDALATYAEHNADITIIGPDDPLALGIVDEFNRRELPVFGPRRLPAQIEWDKGYAKVFMDDNDIPTAPFEIFTKEEYQEALAYVRKHGAPIVIKKCGLCAGKGAFPCHTLPEAEAKLKELLVGDDDHRPEEKVVVEDFLPGPELSIHAISDGNGPHFYLLPESQDHKYRDAGNTGLMTGGMGTYSPVPWVQPWMLNRIKSDIVAPAFLGLAGLRTPFTGCLYPGLKYTPDGFKVLEFNARFGDPETQVYMTRLQSDVLDLFEATIEKRLAQLKLEWSPHFAVCVIMTALGYPGPLEKSGQGVPITGIDHAERISGVTVFHAGTRREGNRVLTAGGRVLGVTALGETLAVAREKAYAAVREIHFEGAYYRPDIADCKN